MQEHYGDNQEHSWFRTGLHGIVEEAYAVAKYRNEPLGIYEPLEISFPWLFALIATI